MSLLGIWLCLCSCSESPEALGYNKARVESSSPNFVLREDPVFCHSVETGQFNGDMYESRPFSVGGYNWTFLIYPNENKPQGSGGYVSLYVRIDNSSLIANPEDVYAEITFLVYKSTIDKYHILKETKAQRFHLFRQQWGQLNFLEIGYLLNPVHGFIFNGGQSVFGVDIFVAKPFENWEVFS